jgi:hydroxyethylthiazole kinase-like uncharacterized protein yjeF
MELLTAAQMRAIEQAAIESGNVTGLELMERAGRGVVEAIYETWPEPATRAGGAGPDSSDPPKNLSGKMKPSALVLCGPGNNGGDGFVVARLLKERGWDISVFLLGAAERLPADARANFDRWPGKVMALPCPAEAVSGADLIIDAVFGTGLTRPVQEQTIFDAKAVEALAKSLACMVAVDVPSGLCADSGQVLGRACRADLTVSFQTPKRGHVLADGPEYCGDLKTVDIGLSDALDVVSRETFDVPLVTRHASQPKVFTKSLGHKFSHGHALILSGPPGKGGAARLAARGALRVGAGLVTVGCPMRAVSEHAAHLNAIMVRGLDGTHGLDEMLEDQRINALCLGPGMGLAATTADLVKRALGAGRATVLDADALSRFQRHPETLFDMLHENCVLTPHGGEFARLFPDLSDRLAEQSEVGPAYSKVDATCEAAKRAGCVVLFKGADTVIAAPDGRCCVNASAYDYAAPWLATAGAGDVLAGLIAGLMAKGQGAFDAATNGAWLHAAAARSFGPGLIAEDLPEELPNVFRQLGLR